MPHLEYETQIQHLLEGCSQVFNDQRMQSLGLENHRKSGCTGEVMEGHSVFCCGALQGAESLLCVHCGRPRKGSVSKSQN
mgnify:CR=1 FL=1